MLFYLQAEQQDKAYLKKMKKWITVRGWGLTIILAIVWPLCSVPAQVFTKDYFAFWVLVSVAWGFGAASECISVSRQAKYLHTPQLTSIVFCLSHHFCTAPGRKSG